MLNRVAPNVPPNLALTATEMRLLDHGNIVMWRGLSRLTDIGLGALVGAKIVGN